MSTVDPGPPITIGPQGGGEVAGTKPRSSDPFGVDPLVIEIEDQDGAGGYENKREARFLGPRFKVDWGVNRIPTATIGVRNVDGFLVNDPVNGLVDVEVLVDDGKRITIRTARQGLETDLVLFRGHMESILRRATGSSKRVDLRCVHTADMFRSNPDLVFDGELWVTRGERAAHLNSPGSTLIRPRRVAALPVVFNPDGARNAAQGIGRIQNPEPAGNALLVPLFNHPWGHPANPVQRWTWARVFQLLYVWPRIHAYVQGGNVVDFPGGFAFRNLIDLIAERRYLDVDPDALSPSDPLLSDPWGKILLEAPRNHSIQGMNWIDALTWTCAKSGLEFVVDTWIDPEDGDVREGFRFLVPEEVRGIKLKMPTKDFSTADKTWAQVLANADVVNLNLDTQYGAVVNEMRVTGGPNRYEVTAELVPGWKYDAARDPQVDVGPNDQQAIDDALQAMTTSAFGNQYATNGVDYFDGDNWAVLRLWILPDAFDLTPTHERPFTGTPWTAAKFEPFDFGLLQLGETDTGEFNFDGNNLSVRPRKIHPQLTGKALSTPHPPLIEASIDGGATWQRINGGVRVLARRFAVYLEVEDLRNVEVRREVTQNFAAAYIAGDLRVRVTGVVEGDDAAESGLLISNESLSKRRRGKVILRREFADELRDNRGVLSGGNSQFKSSGDPANESYDPDPLGKLSKTMERQDRVRTTGSVELPGVVVPDMADVEAADFRPGDKVLGVFAEAGQDQHNVLFLARLDGQSSAILGGVTWEYNPGGGDEKPIASTTLALEDPDKFVKFRG